MTHVKDALIPTVIGFAVPVFLLLAVFGWKVVATIYQDHVSLVTQNEALQNKLIRRNTSGLSLRIKGWIDNQDQDHNAIVQVWLGVDNSGEPSTLRDWKLAVRVGDIVREGRHAIGQAALKSSLNIPFLDTEFQRPVGIIADMQGYVTFGVAGISQQQFDNLYLDHSATLTVSAIDSQDRTIVAEKNIYEAWTEGHRRMPAK